eukprot:scaffold85392_cov30-Tisochrysis_lutea.AAC.3
MSALSSCERTREPQQPVGEREVALSLLRMKPMGRRVWWGALRGVQKGCAGLRVRPGWRVAEEAAEGPRRRPLPP